MIPKYRKCVHPSEVLLNEFDGHLSNDPVIRLLTILPADVTDATAVLLAERLGTSVEFWINLQNNYDRSLRK